MPIIESLEDYQAVRHNLSPIGRWLFTEQMRRAATNNRAREAGNEAFDSHNDYLEFDQGLPELTVIEGSLGTISIIDPIEYQNLSGDTVRRVNPTGACVTASFTAIFGAENVPFSNVEDRISSAYLTEELNHLIDLEDLSEIRPTTATQFMAELDRTNSRGALIFTESPHDGKGHVMAIIPKYEPLTNEPRTTLLDRAYISIDTADFSQSGYIGREQVIDLYGQSLVTDTENGLFRSVVVYHE
jgi:hypothetical protein